MNKIKIFSSTNTEVNEKKVADFIKDKEIVEIIRMDGNENTVSWASKIKIVYKEK